MDITAYPPVQSFLAERPFRIWTVEYLPYGFFPTYLDGGPARVAIGDWGWSVEHEVDSTTMQPKDDGKYTLRVTRWVAGTSIYDAVIDHHYLHGTTYDTADDAHRAAYDAGLIGFIVYLKDEARYGIPQEVTT